MNFNSKKLLIFISLNLFVLGCSKKDDSNNNLNDGKVRSAGINCESGYTPVSAVSADEVVKSAADRNTHTIELKSSKKYGYEQSAYNLSGNCFSRKGADCETNDQLFFHHGGDAKNLTVRGHFVLLEKAASSRFDEISIDRLAELQLKTTDGTVVTRDNIFGNPSADRKLVLGESSISNDYEVGSVALALVDDTWSIENYQLFKIKIDSLTAGETISITYQKIAEVPKSDLKNFYCSKQAEIKKASLEKSEGEAIVYGRSYAGYEASTFGFDSGTNGFDGRFVRSNRVMSFGSVNKCLGSQTEFCISPYVGWVVGYWGGVIDLGDKELKQVERSMWPNLQSIDSKSAAAELRVNKTYLISQLTDGEYTFGAIRISEIDPQGRWVKFNWKRVAIEKPSRFASYTQVAIPSNELLGQTTLSSDGGTQLDIAFAKSSSEQPLRTEQLSFYRGENTLNVDNRYFPTHSGIVDVTSTYRNLDTIPEGAADSLVNKFQRSVPVKDGAIYIVSIEKFWYKATLAIQVIGNVPNKSVTLKYKRLYNGQTFPGQWDKN